MTATELESALAAASASGLSTNILRILCILQDAMPDAITPTHLSTRLNISRAATGELLSHMDARGLIKLRLVVEDRRVTPYTITDHGSAILSRIINRTNSKSSS